jgi:hypothetical protein
VRYRVVWRDGYAVERYQPNRPRGWAC